MSHANSLLGALPTETLQRIIARSQRVSLPPRTILCEMGDTLDSAYFPLNGMASLLSTTEDGDTVEVGSVGAEGMIGLPILTASRSAPYAVAVQLAMETFRINAAALTEELTRAPALNRALTLYVHRLFAQMAHTAVCHRFHSRRQRLCRWLLVARHRAHLNTIMVTQETLAQILGVSRTGITAVAVELQDLGAIRCRHGRITIVNPARLEALSCDCYRALRDEMSVPSTHAPTS